MASKWPMSAALVLRSEMVLYYASEYVASDQGEEYSSGSINVRELG
jgi:hypothetical protein